MKYNGVGDVFMEILEEYKMLRDEIQNCVERDNTLATFMVTAVATILTFAISANLQVPFLFLISFCIIIPFSARLAHYKENVARISAYMIVYLEPKLEINYETDTIAAKNPNSKKSLVMISMRNYVGFWLGAISYIIYVEQYLNKVGLKSIIDFLCLGLPIILLYITYVIDKRIDSVSKIRKNWLEVFTNQKKSKKV